MFQSWLLSAQNSLFTETPTLPGQLTIGQLSRYNKMVAPNSNYTSIKIVQFADLLTIENNGKIVVEDPEGGCGSKTFQAKQVEYKSPTEYMWYGTVLEEGPSGDPECKDCNSGDLLLTKTPDGIIGNLRMGGKLYTIEDLGEGKQAIGTISETVSLNCPGGVQSPEGKAEQGVEDREGNCDIRVLVLATPDAMAAVPNFALLVANAINKVNVTLLNSLITPSQVRLVFIGTESTATYFSEANRTNEGSIMAISNNPTAIARRNATGADIVVLFVDPDTNNPTDNTAGVAFLGGRWAIVEADGGSSSIVMAHELGHTLRAHHEPCSAADPSSGCTNTLGPAHAHTFETGCGKKKTKRKTMMYGETRIAEIIDYYSNPNVSFDGQPTGIAGTRDNASVIRGFGCTASNHSTLFNDAFSVKITGPSSPYRCTGSSVTLYASVSGTGIGNCTYAWQQALGGVAYGPVISVASDCSIILPMVFILTDSCWKTTIPPENLPF